MINIIIALILFFTFTLHLRSNKNAPINLKRNNYFKAGVSIWDTHPKKKYYFILRSIFYFGLVIWAIFSFRRADESFYIMPALLLIFGLLLLVKCPRCKSCLFLQDLNLSHHKAPKICTKCGYPSSEIDTADRHEAMRPIFKWLFYIFIALPLCLILVTFVILAAMGKIDMR